MRPTDAEAPTAGHSAAADTSRIARACCRAACALFTLVLDCRALATRLVSNGSLKRDHHCASKLVPVVVKTLATDQATGTSKGMGAVCCGATEVQPYKPSSKKPMTQDIRVLHATLSRRQA